MSMCVVNYACLWQVLPSHKVSLPTFGQHASHTGAACACAAAVWVCGCWCRLHTYYKHVQLQMPWLKKWWRMQWDVICMVICKTPWSNWFLNVHTASKYYCKLVPIIVCWCASQGAVKPSMLDGVDVVIVCTTIQVPLLVLHWTRTSSCWQFGPRSQIAMWSCHGNESDPVCLLGGSSNEGEIPACHVQSFLYGWHLRVAFLGSKAQNWW